MAINPPSAHVMVSGQHTITSEGNARGYHTIPLSGGVPGASFLAGIAEAGAICQDGQTGNIYENQGTLATPNWVRIDTI